MLKLYDYKCLTCENEFEFLKSDVESNPLCVCGSETDQVFPAPKGYVRNTNNPVKY